MSVGAEHVVVAGCIVVAAITAFTRYGGEVASGTNGAAARIANAGGGSGEQLSPSARAIMQGMEQARAERAATGAQVAQADEPAAPAPTNRFRCPPVPGGCGGGGGGAAPPPPPPPTPFPPAPPEPAGPPTGCRPGVRCIPVPRG